MFKEAERYLSTVRDVLRFAVSRFNEAGLAFGHGSDNAHDEAAYLILHTLNLRWICWNLIWTQFCCRLKNAACWL